MDLSLSHINIHTDDLQESLRFYREVLGFDYLFATPPNDEAPLDMIWLRNSQGVVIELTKDKSDYAAETASRASKNHLALRVPDMEVAVSHLKSHGVEFEIEPMEIVLPFDQPLPNCYLDTFAATDGRTARMKVAFFRGPAGESFEILQDDLL